MTSDAHVDYKIIKIGFHIPLKSEFSALAVNRLLCVRDVVIYLEFSIFVILVLNRGTPIAPLRSRTLD